MIDPATIPAELLQGRYDVPPQPRILLELQRMQAGDEPDVVAMADLIAADVGLASAVLRTINAPFFGMRRHVADIRQAAVLLGARVLVNLATVYQLRQALQLPGCLDLGRFWDTASDTARTCVQIGRAFAVPVPAEELYALGLFHDCGIPPMAQHHPDYRETLAEINADYRRPAAAIEQARHGTDHSLVGYVVAGTWGMPLPIAQAILQNHERDLWHCCDDSTLKQMVAVLKWAENLVDNSRRGEDNPDWAHHRQGVGDTLGLTRREMDDFSVTDMVAGACGR